MYNSSDTDSRRPIILYILIAIALFVALLLAVRWAKSRSDYYAQQQNGHSQPVAEDSGQPQDSPQPAPAEHTPQQSQPAPQGTESTNQAPTPTAVASTGPPTVQSVPSTGPEQIILPVASLSAVVFAGLSYARARRRLRTQALSRS